MNIEEMLDINDCPLCDGGALLEEECGCGYYVMCMECGCHSVTIDFHSEDERLEAAKNGYALEYWKSNFKQSGGIKAELLRNKAMLLQNVMTNITICDNISH